MWERAGAGGRHAFRAQDASHQLTHPTASAALVLVGCLVPCVLGHLKPPLVPPHLWVQGFGIHALVRAACSGSPVAHPPTRPPERVRRLSAWGAFFNETFSITPDFPGVSRALRHTLSPVFAHDRHKGAEPGRPGYRWMLLGDDDTGGLGPFLGMSTCMTAESGWL